MRQIKLLSALITCFVLLTGCATVTVLNLNSGYPAKQPDANIDVYLTTTPKCEYTELAIFEGHQFFRDNDALNEMKARAREIGADAIIIMGSVSTTDYETTTKEKDRHSTTYSTTYSTESNGIRAMAIKYND